MRKKLVCRHMFTVKSRVFHMITRASETVRVLTQYDSCYVRSKLVTTGRMHVFKLIHMKTCTGGVVPIMNQYDTCQLVQKWFLVCWDRLCTVIYSAGIIVSHVKCLEANRKLR